MEEKKLRKSLIERNLSKEVNPEDEEENRLHCAQYWRLQLCFLL